MNRPGPPGVLPVLQVLEILHEYGLRFSQAVVESLHSFRQGLLPDEDDDIDEDDDERARRRRSRNDD
jgi:hypothetical protein